MEMDLRNKYLGHFSHFLLVMYVSVICNVSAVATFPDSPLTIAALECLQHVMDKKIFQSIGENWRLFADELSLPADYDYYVLMQARYPGGLGRAVVEKWLGSSSEGSKPSTWKVLRDLLSASNRFPVAAQALQQFEEIVKSKWHGMHAL